MPWILPDKWRVFGVGRGNSISPVAGTIIQAATSFANNIINAGGTATVTSSTGTNNTTLNISSGLTVSQSWAGYLFQQIYNTGTVSVTHNTTSVTGTGTSFPANPQIVGGTLVSGGAFVGVIQSVTSNTSLTLQAGAAIGLSNASYAIIGPDQGVVINTNTAGGKNQLILGENAINQQTITTAQNFALTPPLVEIGASSGSSLVQGTGIYGVMIDCNNTQGGLGVQTLWGQEESFISNVNIFQCLGAGFDIEGLQAQNFGPVSDITITPGSQPTAQTECVIDSGNPGWRGIHGLTCTVKNDTRVAKPNIGIDESSQSVTLEGMHFEAINTAIEIGAQAPQSGSPVLPGQAVTLSNVTGGNGLGLLVDISNNPATNVNNAIQVEATGMLQSGASVGILRDNIVGANGGLGITTLTDGGLSKYLLGSYAGLGPNSNRTRITTSPNAATAFATVPSGTGLGTYGSGIGAFDNAIITSSVDGNGNPSFFSASGSTLTIKGTTTPLTMMIAGQYQQLTSDTTLTVSSGASQVQYVYVAQDLSNSTLQQADFALSTLIPVYLYTAPSSPTSGQFWFDLSTNLMKKYNGTTWIATAAIFLGEIDVTATLTIDATLCEPYRLNPYRRYEFFGNGSDPSINTTTAIDGLKQVPVLTMNGTSLTQNAQWTSSTPSLGVIVYSQN